MTAPPIRDLYTMPPRRRPIRPLALAVAALVALALALVAGLVLARPALADDTDPPRAEPTSRGANQLERWREVVSVYDWNADTALTIVRCESRGDPGAVNPSSGAQGLFQVMPQTWQRLANAIHGAWVSLLDGQVNTRTAFALYEAFDGWSPWWSSRSCWGGW